MCDNSVQKNNNKEKKIKKKNHQLTKTIFIKNV